MSNVDVEKFIGYWWGTTVANGEMDEWLESSYDDSEPFWKQLFAFHQKVQRNPAISILGESYDFYHDCILRHLSNDLAFIDVKSKDERQEWSYREVHRIVNYQVRKWSKHDLQPGQLIALLLPTGFELLVALLTALRMGLKICYLDPQSPYLGDKQLEKIISEIKPQWIVAEEGSVARAPSSHLPIDITGHSEEDVEPLSYAYTALTSIQTAFALYRQEAQAFVSLDAESLYLHALRDSLMVLNLTQNKVWSTPLACSMRGEPCSMLMSLLAGATRLHVADSVIKNDPKILIDERINLIGVSDALQQLWSRIACMPLRTLKGYYKETFDMDYQAWKAFVQTNKAEKAAAFRLMMDNSTGGIALVSKPTYENIDFSLKPSAGVFWSLDDISGSGEESLSGYGLFNREISTEENNQKSANLTLSRSGKQCFLVGSKHPSKSGVTVPCNQIEAIVNNFPFVEISMLHSLIKSGRIADQTFVLLIFTNPMETEPSETQKEKWNREISQQIAAQVGAGFIPDRIEYYPLLPKMKEGSIDRNWCIRHYKTGQFSRKSEMPSYRILHTLKKLAMAE